MTPPEPKRLEIPTTMAERLEALQGRSDGPVDVERTETTLERHERLQQAQAARNARWTARLPVMFRDASPADLIGQEHAETIQDWLASPSATLVLAGAVGTGKTHAAYAVGNDAVSQGVWTEAWTVTDLLEALRPNGEANAGDIARRCALLVLDDLGVSKVSDWAQEQVTAIVDDRLRNGLRQVITTNAPYEVLAEAWGDRLMDRLRYRWTVVAMTGESRRRTPAW